MRFDRLYIVLALVWDWHSVSADSPSWSTGISIGREKTEWSHRWLKTDCIRWKKPTLTVGSFWRYLLLTNNNITPPSPLLLGHKSLFAQEAVVRKHKQPMLLCWCQTLKLLPAVDRVFCILWWGMYHKHRPECTATTRKVGKCRSSLKQIGLRQVREEERVKIFPN